MRIPRRPTGAPAALAAGALLLGVLGLPALVSPTRAGFTSTATNTGSTFSAAASFGLGGGACPTSPNPVWINGMEHGAANTPYVFTSGTSGAADPGVANSGAYSLRVTKPAGGSGSVTKSTGFVSGSQQVVHFALRLAARPSGTVTLAVLDSATGTDLSLKYDGSTGRLALQWGGEPLVGAGALFYPGAWYTIDLRSDTTTVPLEARWQIDGVDQQSATSTAAASFHSGLVLGSPNAEAPGYTAYFDDLYYSRTLTDYPVGDISVLPLRPNGVNAHVAAGAFGTDGGGSIDASTYQRIDDPALFGGTDYVVQNSANTSAYLEFTMGDTAASCILGVQGYAALGTIGGQAGSLRATLTTGAVTRTIYSGTSPCNNCAQPVNALIQPPGAAWTQADVNALLLRLGHGDTASPPPYWAAAVVEYATR